MENNIFVGFELKSGEEMIKIESFAFFILMIFSFIGTMVISVATHELVHFQDYKEIATKGELCLFNIPTNHSTMLDLRAKIGYYHFCNLPEDDDKEAEIDKYSEKKAIFFNLIPVIIFIVCLIIILNKRYKRTTENG